MPGAAVIAAAPGPAFPLMSISTKTGDDGTSGLLFNRRVPKTDPHIEACGSVDELTAALGIARAAAGPGALNDEILRIQHELFTLMSEMALLDEDRPRYEERFKGKYIDAHDACPRGGRQGFLQRLGHAGRDPAERRAGFRPDCLPARRTARSCAPGAAADA